MPRGVEEFQKKLPEYRTLRYLFLTKGLSYKEIGELYGVHATSVGKTLRARARRRGEYPFPKTNVEKIVSRKISKSNKTRNLNGIAIFEMVSEHRDELGLTWEQYALKAGIKVRTMMDYRMRHKNGVNPLPMSKKNARTLLEFMGEKVPPWL